MIKRLICSCLCLTSAVPATGQGPVSCTTDRSLKTDTITVFLGFSVPEDLGIPKNVNGEYLLNGQSIASQFRAPSRWEFPLWPGTYDPKLGPPTLGLEGLLVFRVDRIGRLQSSQYTASAGAPGLAAALVLALHRADSAGLLLAPAAKGGTRADTTVALELTTSLERRLGFVPIALIKLAVRPLDKSVEVENIPKPAFPPEALAEGRAGSVTVQYVVDETGRVDPTTLQILYSDGDEFMREGVLVLLKGKFKPARMAGCPARELVQQRIMFKIGR